MFTKEIFGQRLLEIRKLNHETQTDLAEAIDTVKSRISEIENGKNTTTIEKFALICEHYKVSADYLLGLSDDPKLAAGSEPQCPAASPDDRTQPQE